MNEAEMYSGGSDGVMRRDYIENREPNNKKRKKERKEKEKL